MMLLSQVARAISGRPSVALGDARVGGVSTDTRSLRPGDLFFAIRGGSFDAHDFVGEALAKGACAAVVERAVVVPGPVIEVPDTVKALGALAAAWRITLRARVIGVAGSNGKTTTKDMIAHVLGADRRLVKAQGSFNNSVGVPHTIFQAREETEIAVLEIGTNHPGEIAYLGQMARPDTAVLVSIGAEHLEGLGSIDGVADEETSLLDYVRGGGSAVLHDDPRILSRVRLPAEKVVTFGMTDHADLHPTDVDGCSFRMRGVSFRLGLVGEWNVQNALAAVAVGLLHGVPLPECARRLETFKGPKMRMERLSLGGVMVINDAYNSNPESAGRAIREFSGMRTSGRKVAVIGDMRELGAESPRYHREIGALLAESAVDVVVTVGRESRAALEVVGSRKEAHGFDSVDEMRPGLDALVREGDLVLLKGSRSMALERLVKWMAERVA